MAHLHGPLRTHDLYPACLWQGLPGEKQWGVILPSSEEESASDEQVQ